MPLESRNIVIIGAGNVAHALGRAFKHSTSRVILLIDRSEERAERLAFEIGCPYSTDLRSVPDETDIVIMAVSDDAIPLVSAQLYCPGKVVAHTSGSVPMEALGDCSDRIGVFYPLQTLHRDVDVNMRQVPFCIEGNSKWNEGMLLELARTISGNVQLINSEQRKMVHLAAVFACNFSNHCYALAEELLNSSGISIDILCPLILQTAQNVQKHRPVQVQTGPAKRGDTKVMDAHRELLRPMDPELMALYDSISAGIIKRAVKGKGNL